MRNLRAAPVARTAKRATRVLMKRIVLAFSALLVAARPAVSRASDLDAPLVCNVSAHHFVSDLAVTCSPYQRGEQLVKDPILIVEILSPGTERHDRRTKLPVYRDIDSVSEILLIDSESVFAEILRRDGDRWITELVQERDAILRLASVDLSVAMK